MKYRTGDRVRTLININWWQEEYIEPKKEKE